MTTQHRSTESITARRRPAMCPLIVMLLLVMPVGLTSLLGMPLSFGQTTSPPKPSDSLDWKSRREAFAQVLGIDPAHYDRGAVPFIGPVFDKSIAENSVDGPAKRLQLIELLEVENRVVQESKVEFIAHGSQERGRLSEEYLNYYGDLIAAVTRISDKRSLNALLGAITTGGMVTKALVSLGSHAASPVANLLGSDDPVERASAVIVLTEMLDNAPDVSKDGDKRALIESTMLKAASDKDPFVRRRSVDGLSRLGSPASIEMIEKLAASDPYRADIPGMVGRYIVRDAAKEALAQIRAK